MAAHFFHSQSLLSVLQLQVDHLFSVLCSSAPHMTTIYLKQYKSDWRKLLQAPGCLSPCVSTFIFVQDSQEAKPRCVPSHSHSQCKYWTKSRRCLDCTVIYEIPRQGRAQNMFTIFMKLLRRSIWQITIVPTVYYRHSPPQLHYTGLVCPGLEWSRTT